MNLILLLATFGMTTGLFCFCNISPTEFTEGIFEGILGKPQGLRGKINHNTKRKKDNFLVREIREVQSILVMTGATQIPIVVRHLSFLLFYGWKSCSIDR